jgi:hypothetical protein
MLPTATPGAEATPEAAEESREEGEEPLQATTAGTTPIMSQSQHIIISLSIITIGLSNNPTTSSNIQPPTTLSHTEAATQTSTFQVMGKRATTSNIHLRARCPTRDRCIRSIIDQEESPRGEAEELLKSCSSLSTSRHRQCTRSSTTGLLWFTPNSLGQPI